LSIFFKNSNRIRVGVLEANNSKILITFGEYVLFSVFYFFKIHLSFPQKEKIGVCSNCSYVIPVIHNFFGNVWGHGFVKKKRISKRDNKNANFDLDFWGRGGVVGKNRDQVRTPRPRICILGWRLVISKLVWVYHTKLHESPRVNRCYTIAMITLFQSLLD